MVTFLQRSDDGLPMRPTGPWAAAKLDYLRRYIEVFETAMRGKWKLRNYIDLLAGPGKNRVRGTDEILLGSPLLALDIPHPFTGYYFVDYDPTHTEALRVRCSASPQANLVHIGTGDCNLLVDGIVSELKREQQKSLNLAFLDPEGLELHWSTVARLASVMRMDLIINYPQGGLNRAMKPAFAQTGATAVDRFFGDRTWRVIYAKWLVDQRVGLHRQLIDMYKAKLLDLGYVDVRWNDEVGDEPLIRNVRRNAPLYRLLFASKNELGEKFWQAITRRDVYGQRSLFDAQ